MDHRLRRRIPDKPAFGYRRALFPTRYDPVAAGREQNPDG